jgi:hypothetical protein
LLFVKIVKIYQDLKPEYNFKVMTEK